MGVNRPLKKVEINIDKAKKEREVAEIVESDDFKLLEQRANKFRQKEITTESQLEAEIEQRSPFSQETAIAQPAKPELIAPELQSKSKTPPAPALTKEFLEHCQQQLARFIGPLASVLLEDTLAQSPDLTPEQLIAALTEEIPDRQRAQEFKNYIKIPPQSQPKTEAPVDKTFSQEMIGTHPATLTREFLEHCRQELMRCIGPMADILLKDTLAKSSHLTSEQLIEALAAEIPDIKRAKEFKNRMRIL